jgi:hypothetical protein
MAFKLVSRQGGDTPPFEYRLMADDEGCKLGEALTESAGRLTMCDPAIVPGFIAMRTKAAEDIAITPVPVIRVTELMEFGTTFAADGAGVNVGDKVAISDDGLQVTAAREGGVFMVSGKSAVASAGSPVTGFFRR